MKKPALALAAVAAGVTLLTGCSDAEVASRNLSNDADNFKIDRRIVFTNTVTGKYELVIEGRCNIVDQENQLEVTCDTPDGYKKHFLGLTETMTYVAEQLQGAEVSKDHYKVVFKPESVIPDFEIR